MATHHGKNGVVKVGNNAVAEVTNFTITETAETADDSAMGDGSRTHLVGMKAWTASVDCHWDETDTQGQVAMAVGASITFGGYPEGGASGATYASGTATITSITKTTSLTGVVSASMQLQGNGALTWSTV